MSLFSWLKRKKKWSLDEDLRAEATARAQETRLRAGELRALEHTKRVMEQQQEIARLKAEIADLDGSDDNDDEKDDGLGNQLLNLILARAVGTGQTNAFLQNAPNSTISPPVFQANSARSFNNEQIEEIISQIPKSYRKIARKMNDETLRQLIRSKFDADEDSISRAVAIIRTK